MDLRTFTLIAKFLNQDDFKIYGNIIDYNNSSSFKSDNDSIYQIRIIEIDKSDSSMNVLRCHQNSQIIMMPLEHVKYFLTVGPAIDSMRTRPFPGTNEIKAFYSEGMQGFTLEKGVWFSKPIVTESSLWLEFCMDFNFEERNYERILKVNFKLEHPN
ncbi:MAG: ureidoglycolate lyase [Planctomycetes bacterium]|nr:ureidoglycolate lyase [Planctomycetota bacterium]